MAGRPRKPIAQKKLEGTYTKYRDEERDREEQKISLLLPSGGLKVPKSITDSGIRKAYKSHIELLRSLGTAAEQKADSPLLEMAYMCLQSAKKSYEALQEFEPFSDEYVRAENSFHKNVTKFESIVKEFYLSPSARAKLKLDALTATEKEQNIEKNKSVIASLLEKKQS